MSSSSPAGNRSTWIKSVKAETRFLIHVIITYRCNLDCIYCYQSDRRQHDDLDYDKAKKALYEVLDEINPENEGIIRFFGGEPLLRFDLIRQLTADARSYWRKTKNISSNLFFGISTNGTLMNEEIKTWLLENPDVSVTISLDGTPHMHNTNRSGSFEFVKPHLDFIKRYGVPVKMTISPYTIDGCADGIRFINEQGLECQANIVFEDVWGDNESHLGYLKAFSNELAKLVTYYADNPEIPRSTLFIPLTAHLPRSVNQKFLESFLCGITRNMITIGLDGNKYTCERTIPFHENGSFENFDLNRKQLKPEECEECPLLPLCPECRAYNFEYYQDANRKTTFHCEFLQLQLRASSLLFFKDILRLRASGELEKLDEESKIALMRELETATFIENYTRSLHERVVSN